MPNSKTVVFHSLSRVLIVLRPQVFLRADATCCNRRSIYFVHAMAIIYDFWVSWQELHELANVSQVLRPWRPELPTSTVTSTTTFTSTSATSTTSTNTPGPFPQLQPSSSAVLGALEIAFSDPLEASAVWSGVELGC